MRKVLSRFYEKWDLYARELAPHDEPGACPGFSFETTPLPVAAKEWDLIVKHRGERYLRIVTDRLKHPDEFSAFVVKKNESHEIIASAWTRVKPFYEEKLRMQIDLRPGEAFFFDAFCIPDYRGRGFQRRLMSMRIDCACRLGLQKGFTVVSHDNLPSQKTIESLGFMKKKSRVYLTFGPLKRFIRRFNKMSCSLI